MSVSNTEITDQTNVHPVHRARKKILFITCLVLIGFSAYTLPPLLLPRLSPEGHSSGLILDKPACKMYEIDPFEPSVNRYLEYRALQKCRRPLIYSSGEVLKYDENHENYASAICCARTIQRKEQSPFKYTASADWLVTISKKCSEIPKFTGLSFPSEFVQVTCRRAAANSKTTTDYYGTPFPPETHSERTAMKKSHWESAKTIQPPSVLIVGIDAISRLHFKRSMSQTAKLLEKSGFIELKGYTKIGDNTFPNFMALLAGMEHYRYPCWRGGGGKFDDCPFIWKSFSKQNYVTGYLEESPTLSAFNYHKTGFVQQPTDYYLRPLGVAYHGKLGRTRRFTGCVGGVTMTEMMARYTTEFVDRMGETVPYFLLSWYTSPAHDDFNGLKPFDPTFLELIEHLLKSPGGKNAIILCFSDHGHLFGNFRHTALGYYEASLPFFFVRLPPSIKDRRPDWLQSLQRNSHRLTSTLDIHATLEDILSLSNSKLRFKHSNWNYSNSISRTVYSLFEPIPLNRTCKSALIPQDYCRCGVNLAVGKRSSGSIGFGNLVVAQVNAILKAEIKRKVCVRLKFKEFLHVREIRDGEVWNGLGKLEPFVDHLVGLVAEPSGAHFEANVRLFPDNGTMMIVGEISRINSYEGQNDCLEGYELKNYCMCVDYYEKTRRRTRGSKRQRKTVARKEHHRKSRSAV